MSAASCIIPDTYDKLTSLLVASLLAHMIAEYERAKRAYQELSEIKKQKLNKIYRKRPALQKAVKWVTENQEKFRKPVYGPVGAELDCASEDIAKIVDQHVSNAVLMAFVCETKEVRRCIPSRRNSFYPLF